MVKDQPFLEIVGDLVAGDQFFDILDPVQVLEELGIFCTLGIGIVMGTVQDKIIIRQDFIHVCSIKNCLG
jgi:hypothetical protein